MKFKWFKDKNGSYWFANDIRMKQYKDGRVMGQFLGCVEKGTAGHWYAFIPKFGNYKRETEQFLDSRSAKDWVEHVASNRIGLI